MKNKTINLGVIKKVAQALGELNERVVFVGANQVGDFPIHPPTKFPDLYLHLL